MLLGNDVVSARYAKISAYGDIRNRVVPRSFRPFGMEVFFVFKENLENGGLL